MKYLALALFVLILAWNMIFYHNNRKQKKNKKASADRLPPVFNIKNNYIPIKDNCNICISEYLEYGSLLQLHCSITENGEIVRGYCSKDLTSFEVKVRSEIRKIFDQLEDAKTDRTIKMWYKNEDSRELDTEDIPLKIIITFYKPEHFNDEIGEILKRSVCPLLRELVEVDWGEINGILQGCCEKKLKLQHTLSEISNSYEENGISDSAKIICRHLSMDMRFFYENQWFYGGGKSPSVYEKLREKYPEIENRYIECLSHEFAKDTLW